VGGHVLEMTEEKYCNLTENEFWKFWLYCHFMKECILKHLRILPLLTLNYQHCMAYMALTIIMYVNASLSLSSY
jgi:hypothetical protein